MNDRDTRGTEKQEEGDDRVNEDRRKRKKEKEEGKVDDDSGRNKIITAEYIEQLSGNEREGGQTDKSRREGEGEMVGKERLCFRNQREEK